MSNTLALQEWLDVIRTEYLRGFVKDGGSSIKFAVPIGFDLAPLLKEALTSMAIDLGYAVTKIDASDTRVHMPQDIFFAIASQIDWRLLARRVVLKLSEDAGYPTGTIDATNEVPVLEAISAAHSVDETLVRLELRQRLPDAVTRDVNMSRDFRVAMTQLCLTEMGNDGQSRAASALIEWLTGENRQISNVRSYSIYNGITRTNAKHFFESLLYWTRLAGYSGTVVLLDNSRVLLRQNPRDGLRFYSRSAVMDHYELLRELIDGTDRLEGFFMVIVSDGGFLDDNLAGRGYSIYQPLMGRIADEVRDRSQANPMSALIRLADSTGRE